MVVSERPRLVIYTADVLGPAMAGSAIRAYRFAQALAPHADVRLISETQADLSSDSFEILRAGGDELLRHIEWSDVLLLQSPLLTWLPEILAMDTLVVSDLYNPFILEELQRDLFLDAPADVESTSFTVRAIGEMVRYADFMICSSEKQRDLWMGELMAQGRLNPITYRDDPSLRRLIDVVPFGVDDHPPTLTAPGIKGVVEGISETDKVLLWGGGIYDWFDPVTLIRAVGVLAPAHPDLKLFFLAKQHANPAVGMMKMADDAIAEADRLGLLGSSVFFNEKWVTHEDRANYFLDADVGVSTHLEHLETRYSFRTRLLDYLWAGLPIINTSGDAFESVITVNQLGAAVTPGDVDELAREIEALVYDDERLAEAAARSAAVADDFRWAKAVEPLVEFVRHSRGAADDPRRSARNRRDAPVGGDAAHIELLTRRIEELESSSSWKLTAPFRKLAEWKSNGR